MSRHQQWVKVSGRVLDRQVLPGRNAPHPKLVTVELSPEGGASVEAQVHLIPGKRDHWDEDLYYPAVGDVTVFLYDPASGEARFDFTDPRNSMAAHLAAGDVLVAMAENYDAGSTEDGSGPPWLVPAKCPHCGKHVNQKIAAAESQPHCMNCAQILPAYPLPLS